MLEFIVIPAIVFLLLSTALLTAVSAEMAIAVAAIAAGFIGVVTALSRTLGSSTR